MFAEGNRISCLPAPENFEAHKRGQMDFQASFPGVKVTLDEVVAQGTRESGTIFYHFHMTGTGKGMFRGMPVDGKKINYQGFIRHHIVDGKVVEGWQVNDDVTFLTQLGMIPAAAGAAPA